MTEKGKNTVTKIQNSTYISAVGKRKEAIARVRIYQNFKEGQLSNYTDVKKGEIYVNSKPIAEYFSNEADRYTYTEPLRVTNAHQKNFTITIKVVGGGPAGQLDAVVAGIANALQKLNREEYRSILKKNGFLTRDARIRQRRNVGTGGKARRQKQSPKR